jgi:fluoroacetyl-CoA thioesterase
MTEPKPPKALQVGLEGRFEREVLFEYTTKSLDPKLPAIFSTPAMIGMMEAATSLAVDAALDPGHITVGTRVEVDHIKAAKQGTLVKATARLAEINGRFLTFDVEAHAGHNLLGRGKIIRAIVDLARIQERAAKPHHKPAAEKSAPTHRPSHS